MRSLMANESLSERRKEGVKKRERCSYEYGAG